MYIYVQLFIPNTFLLKSTPKLNFDKQHMYVALRIQQH